jgi:hypothetical protein
MSDPGMPIYQPARRDLILGGVDPYKCGAVFSIRDESGHVLTWVPVKTLKPKHKKNYRKMIRALCGEGCPGCQQVIGEKTGKAPDNLDHLDGDLTHNCFHNFPNGLTHHNCNAARYWDQVRRAVAKDIGTPAAGMGVSLTGRERDFRAHTRTKYSAQEGNDHAVMRRNWDDWIRGRRPVIFPLYEDLFKSKRFTKMSLEDAALQATWACKDPEDEVAHSSKTFAVFAKEDAACGIFDTEVYKGSNDIQFSEWFAKILQRDFPPIERNRGVEMEGSLKTEEKGEKAP